MRDIRIEKDAEWLKLEGKVGQLRGSLAEAQGKLTAHAEAKAAQALGVVVGETDVVDKKGDRYRVCRVEWTGYSAWVHGRKIRKDGQPADRDKCLFQDWSKAE